MTNLHIPYSLRSHRLCVPKVPERLQDGLVPRSRVNRCGQTTEKKNTHAHTQNNDFIGWKRKISVPHVQHATRTERTLELLKAILSLENVLIIPHQIRQLSHGTSATCVRLPHFLCKKQQEAAMNHSTIQQKCLVNSFFTAPG